MSNADSAAFAGTVAQSEEIELSVVMPCLNEAKTVGICVDKALEFIKANSIRG